MISKIPDNSDALLSRAQTAEALIEAGWRRVEPSRAREIHIDYANGMSWFARSRLLHSGRKEGAESPPVRGDGIGYRRRQVAIKGTVLVLGVGGGVRRV